MAELSYEQGKLLSTSTDSKLKLSNVSNLIGLTRTPVYNLKTARFLEFIQGQRVTAYEFFIYKGKSRGTEVKKS